jgi:pyruvate/2-oxoglutarate dehydrogenase complex dihydrolipoamide dehydrogenase (E3) component
MSLSERYECLILGSGNGGMYLAWHLARSGKRTAVIERQWIGGSCPNINCLPSKNEIWSAKVADLIHHADKFGATTGAVAINMAAVRQRKRKMVEELKTLALQEYHTSGVELIMGSGRFTAAKTLEVRLNDGGMRVLTGDQVFINLGTHATIPSVPGLEMAQAYRRFGSRVSVIERGPQLAGREDPDIAAEMHRILADEGIEVLVGTQVQRVERSSSRKVAVVARTAAGERTIEGSDVLVAVGRTPNTTGIGLEMCGIELDAGGLALYCPARCGDRAPNPGRRLGRAFLSCARPRRLGARVHLYDDRTHAEASI